MEKSLLGQNLLQDIMIPVILRFQISLKKWIMLVKLFLVHTKKLSLNMLNAMSIIMLLEPTNPKQSMIYNLGYLQKLLNYRTFLIDHIILITEDGFLACV